MRQLRKLTALALLAFASIALAAGEVAAQTRYYPSIPVIVTPIQPNGFSPLNGAPNTTNTVVNNSAFDPYRELSKSIPGNVRPVNRPAAGGGWEVGQEWYNPVTGQWHAQTQTISGNGMGGIHTQNNFRSAPTGSNRPAPAPTAAPSTPRMPPPYSRRR